MKWKLKYISRANRRFKQALAVGFGAAILFGCSSSEVEEDEDAEGHPLVGEITGIDAEARMLEVAHEDIPGFMPAMTMRFKVSLGDIQNASIGQRIRARLVRGEAGEFQLIKIWPLDEEAARDLKRTNARLSKQAKALPSGYYYGEGDESPDFALLDQFGKVVSSDRLAGKPFMMNFIFTRCPDPNMCPLSTRKMAELQKSVANAGFDINFVSVTLDPEFDTPGVLRVYAEGYGIDGSNFHFVTGPKSAVRDMVKALGVTSIEKVDTIMHSLATVLVGADGTILKRSEKSAWTTEEFMEALRSLPKS